MTGLFMYRSECSMCDLSRSEVISDFQAEF